MRNPKAGPRGRRRAPCMNARSFFLVPPREREEGMAGGGAVANAASLCDPRAPVTRPRPLESRPRPLGVHLAPPPIRPRLAIARAVCARSFPPLCQHAAPERARREHALRVAAQACDPAASSPSTSVHTGERCGLADCVLTRHQHPRPSRKRMRAVRARKAQSLAQPDRRGRRIAESPAGDAKGVRARACSAPTETPRRTTPPHHLTRWCGP